jgi:3-oxoacyl-[acyl-carrier protein] reductase
MKDDFDLTERVALVTGGSSGIGAATAAMLAECGARVAIGYHDNPDAADDLVRQIAQSGGKAVALRADLHRVAAAQALVEEAAAALGPIDILVNGAGSLIRRSPLPQLTEDDWNEVLSLNLSSAVFCAKAVAPSMIARRHGAIVNIGSIAGHNGGGPGAGPYAAAKAGLMAMTKSLAKELAPHGVRVNAVSPGVDTAFIRCLRHRDDAQFRGARFRSGGSARRRGAPKPSPFSSPTPPATSSERRSRSTVGK